MTASSPQARVQALLRSAGLSANGSAPCDPQIHRPEFYARVLAQGSLGLGETYMDGWWDAADLDGFIHRLFVAGVHRRAVTARDVLAYLRARWLNRQRGRRAWAVGRRHYDLGNDLFQAMLGERLVYSCGYWREAGDLDAAQEAKLDLVCRKLMLRPGLRVLDIGCGWGEALKFAAERYGVAGVGVTVSERQADYARALCRGLPVEIRLCDYRDVDERFDRIFSLGMFEHVGARNYRGYFELAHRCLGDDGLFLLHTIGSHRRPNRPDPWIDRYIFPNSQIPAASQVASAVQELFVVEDWHNFGADYEPTLLAWRRNFLAAWPALAQRYDERFRRMWLYYLAVSIASFRARRLQLWQLVLSPNGVPGGYLAPR